MVHTGCWGWGGRGYPGSAVCIFIGLHIMVVEFFAVSYGFISLTIGSRFVQLKSVS